MNDSEREPLTSKGTWAPFMCPNCRGLFRAPLSAKSAAYCPLCDHEIEFPISSQPPEQEEDLSPNVPVRRRRQSKPVTDRHSWDKQSPQEQNKPNNSGLIWATLFILSVGLAVAAYSIFNAREAREKTVESSTDSSEKETSFRVPGSTSSSSRFSQSFSKTDPLVELETKDLEIAREATAKFLQCQTIEEMAPLIREPERVVPLMREYYAKFPFNPQAPLSVDGSGVAHVAKQFTSFEVVLEDYSSRPIAVELTEKGPLIDWESWVSHCEIPWKSLIANHVKTETLVRVTVSHATYYNFSFRDDSQWACYRLSRTPDEPVIYGYVSRVSPIVNRLPGPGDPEATTRLRIRFPEPTVKDNQVIITDYVGSGWVKGL